MKYHQNMPALPMQKAPEEMPARHLAALTINVPTSRRGQMAYRESYGGHQPSPRGR